MRKTRLVILPGARCLNQLGFLLLFLACPTIAFKGQENREVDSHCQLLSSNKKWYELNLSSDIFCSNNLKCDENYGDINMGIGLNNGTVENIFGPNLKPNETFSNSGRQLPENYVQHIYNNRNLIAQSEANTKGVCGLLHGESFFSGNFNSRIPPNSKSEIFERAQSGKYDNTIRITNFNLPGSSFRKLEQFGRDIPKGTINQNRRITVHKLVQERHQFKRNLRSLSQIPSQTKMREMLIGTRNTFRHTPSERELRRSNSVNFINKFQYTERSDRRTRFWQNSMATIRHNINERRSESSKRDLRTQGPLQERKEEKITRDFTRYAVVLPDNDQFLQRQERKKFTEKIDLPRQALKTPRKFLSLLSLQSWVRLLKKSEIFQSNGHNKRDEKSLLLTLRRITMPVVPLKRRSEFFIHDVRNFNSELPKSIERSDFIMRNSDRTELKYSERTQRSLPSRSEVLSKHLETSRGNVLMRSRSLNSEKPSALLLVRSKRSERATTPSHRMKHSLQSERIENRFRERSEHQIRIERRSSTRMRSYYFQYSERTRRSQPTPLLARKSLERSGLSYDSERTRRYQLSERWPLLTRLEYLPQLERKLLFDRSEYLQHSENVRNSLSDKLKSSQDSEISRKSSLDGSDYLLHSKRLRRSLDKAYYSHPSTNMRSFSDRSQFSHYSERSRSSLFHQSDRVRTSEKTRRSLPVRSSVLINPERRLLLEKSELHRDFSRTMKPLQMQREFSQIERKVILTTGRSALLQPLENTRLLATRPELHPSRNTFTLNRRAVPLDSSFKTRRLLLERSSRLLVQSSIQFPEIPHLTKRSLTSIEQKSNLDRSEREGNMLSSISVRRQWLTNVAREVTPVYKGLPQHSKVSQPHIQKARQSFNEIKTSILSERKNDLTYQRTLMNRLSFSLPSFASKFRSAEMYGSNWHNRNLNRLADFRAISHNYADKASVRLLNRRTFTVTNNEPRRETKEKLFQQRHELFTRPTSLQEATRSSQPEIHRNLYKSTVSLKYLSKTSQVKREISNQRIFPQIRPNYKNGDKPENNAYNLNDIKNQIYSEQNYYRYENRNGISVRNLQSNYQRIMSQKTDYNMKHQLYALPDLHSSSRFDFGIEMRGFNSFKQRKSLGPSGKWSLQQSLIDLQSWKRFDNLNMIRGREIRLPLHIEFESDFNRKTPHPSRSLENTILSNRYYRTKLASMAKENSGKLFMSKARFFQRRYYQSKTMESRRKFPGPQPFLKRESQNSQTQSFHHKLHGNEIIVDLKMIFLYVFNNFTSFIKYMAAWIMKMEFVTLHFGKAALEVLSENKVIHSGYQNQDVFNPFNNNKVVKESIILFSPTPVSAENFLMVMNDGTKNYYKSDKGGFNLLHGGILGISLAMAHNKNIMV